MVLHTVNMVAHTTCYCTSPHLKAFFTLKQPLQSSYRLYMVEVYEHACMFLQVMKKRQSWATTGEAPSLGCLLLGTLICVRRLLS